MGRKKIIEKLRAVKGRRKRKMLNDVKNAKSDVLKLWDGKT